MPKIEAINIDSHTVIKNTTDEIISNIQDINKIIGRDENKKSERYLKTSQIRELELSLSKIENEIGMIGRGIKVENLNDIKILQSLYNRAINIRTASFNMVVELDAAIERARAKK